ncbi:related to multidrug resistant [Lecanosticta acicola]|uniref:Related to multidrug resistant n=1 Tax=Lecanosticta acicola TaxID=111012 RepID=A0AAI9E4C6_9PEZI|nr:related to multidrug resistant [Lecanosticta acicola]
MSRASSRNDDSIQTPRPDSEPVLQSHLVLRPPTADSISISHRLSNISSVSEWTKRTISCVQEAHIADSLMWFRHGANSPDDSRRDEDDAFRKDSVLDRANLVADKGSAAQDVVDLTDARASAAWRNPDRSLPMNWGNSRKWMHVVVLSWLSFVASLGSLWPAPATPEEMKELRLPSRPIVALTVSSYMLCFAFAPLFLVPLSELYGRVPVYQVSNICLLAFTLGCAFSQTYQQLIIFRCLAGTLGTACLGFGGATVSDLFDPTHAATPMALWAAGSLLGPFLGPVFGGQISQWLSWRWLFRILAGVACFNVFLCLATMRETCEAVLLERRVAEIRSSGGKRQRLSLRAGSMIHPGVYVRRSVLRTLKLLLFHPVVAAVSFSIATFYGVFCLAAITLPFTFSRKYGFNSSQTGLAYLAPLIGLLFGLIIAGLLSTARCQGGHIQKPEDRVSIAVAITAGTLASSGLAMYGWTAHHGIFWAAPLAGLVLFGLGLLPFTLPLQSYLVDCFPNHTASAEAANEIPRSLVTGLLPLAGLALYDNLGFSVGNTLLAGVTAAAILGPIVCKIWGEGLRERFKLEL